MSNEIKTEHIELMVQSGQDGSQHFFKIKGTAKIIKLMNFYCEKMSLDVKAIVFLFNGRRLLGEETPNDLGMEGGDIIDAMAHQIGG